MDERLRVIIVIGTRPEAIKMFPVIHELERSQIVKPYVVTTGQHAEMCDDVLKMAGIKADAHLAVERQSGTINELSIQVMQNIAGVIENLQKEDTPGENPRTIATVVHGDTTSAMAAAVASAQAGLPVMHVEAGLRTYNPRGPFPEEMNRQIIARLAVVQVAPTMVAEANLVREMVREDHTYVSGNTGIDALLWAGKQEVSWSDERLETVGTGGERLIVATLHRRENWDNLEALAGALGAIADQAGGVKIVLPMHPNPKIRETLTETLGKNPNILLVGALGYIEFAHLLARATLVITDSGGIQEEAPSVGSPVLVVRDDTERGEGVAAGTLLLVGTNPATLEKEALALLANPAMLEKMSEAKNPFGDGHAAERIRALVEYLVAGGIPPASFGSAISRNAVLEAAGYKTTTHMPSEVEHDEALAERVSSPGHLKFGT